MALLFLLKIRKPIPDADVLSNPDVSHFYTDNNGLAILLASQENKTKQEQQKTFEQIAVLRRHKHVLHSMTAEVDDDFVLDKNLKDFITQTDSLQQFKLFFV